MHWLPHSSARTFPSPPKRPLSPFEVYPYSHPHFRKPLSYFLSLWFYLFWTFPEPIICDCLHLASLTEHSVFEMCPCCRCVRGSFVFIAWIHHAVLIHSFLIHWWIFAWFLVQNNVAQYVSTDKSLHAHMFSFLFKFLGFSSFKFTSKREEI